MEVGESLCLTPPNGGEWAASHWGHLDSPGLIPGPRPAQLSIALAAMTLCVGTGPPLQQVQWAIGWILGPGVGAPSVRALVRNLGNACGLPDQGYITSCFGGTSWPRPQGSMVTTLGAPGTTG